MDIQRRKEGHQPEPVPRTPASPGPGSETPWGALARVLPDNLLREAEAADAYRRVLTALVARGHLTLHEAAQLEDMAGTDGVARALVGLADHLVERLEAR